MNESFISLIVENFLMMLFDVFRRRCSSFAWSDDASIQREIIALDTPDDIYFFLKSHEAAVYVIDQMDACTESENTFSTWLISQTAGN